MVEDDKGVESVSPLVGRGRRVGLLAEEFDDEGAPGQRLPYDRIDRVRMDLEDDVRMGEDPVLDHADLAAAAFLGRRRDDLDRAGEVAAKDGFQDDGGVDVPAVPMMLWPQAWPSPGRASISAVKVTRGPFAEGP